MEGSRSSFMEPPWSGALEPLGVVHGRGEGLGAVDSKTTIPNSRALM